jgi:cytochrome P450
MTERTQRRPDERVHRCGALLTKEETRVALETLFRRIPSIKLDEEGKIEWYRNTAKRRPATVLLLVFDVSRTGAPG